MSEFCFTVNQKSFSVQIFSVFKYFQWPAGIRKSKVQQFLTLAFGSREQGTFGLSWDRSAECLLVPITVQCIVTISPLHVLIIIGHRRQIFGWPTGIQKYLYRKITSSKFCRQSKIFFAMYGMLARVWTHDSQD